MIILFLFNNMNHNELIKDFMLGRELAITEVFLNDKSNIICRADVIDIKHDFNKMDIHIIEIKASREDFLSDIRTEKFKKYLQHCNRFSFGINEGIANKNEIPAKIGLIVRNKNGWKTVKQSKKINEEVSYQTLQSLLIHRIQQSKDLINRERNILYKRMHPERMAVMDKEKEIIRFYKTWHWQINKLKEEGIL